MSQNLHGEIYTLLRRVGHSLRSFLFPTLICCLVVAAEVSVFGAVFRNPRAENASAQFAALASSSEKPETSSYKWNVEGRELPLLELSADALAKEFDQSLVYSVDGFDFPVFKALSFDEQEGRYLLPIVSRESREIHFVDFVRENSANTYVSADGTNIRLVDNGTLKTFRLPSGARYLFVRYPDGEFRCATIKTAGGLTVNLLYAANGLTLRGMVDSIGRSVTFNYGKDGIQSVTQTWMANSAGQARTWTVGDQAENQIAARFAHSSTGLKSMPANAVKHEYTAEMAASDKLLAQIFGGPNAVVGANGFEPRGLGASYPLYRGDVIGDDGRLRLGHLSHAMHLYGSADGRGDSPIYIPAGFTSHSPEPSPTDAAVLFYYPRLGNFTDVTLAVFHVADFHINYEGDRVRIGNIGGMGGSTPLYRHSHIDFYRGNVSLPSASQRAALRIDPALVFAPRADQAKF
jgi:hypothetical protein